MAFKKKSIQSKLLMTLVPVVLVSFIVLSVVSYKFSQSALSSSARETATAVGYRYAEQLKANMDSISGYLRTISNMQAIREGQDQEQIVTILSEMFDKIGMFDVLFFIWPDGHALRSTNTTFDAKEREYFKKVLSTKASYVSNTMISSSSGKPSVVVCEPVMNGGELVGMLGVTYNLERMDNLLKNVKFKDTGFAGIVDKAGLTISHPRFPEFIGKLDLSKKRVDLAAGLSFSEVDDSLLELFAKVSSNWTEAAMGGYSLGGVDYDCVMVPINLQGDQHWAIGVAAPAAEVNRDVVTLFKVMAVISTVFVVLALLFVVVISRKVAGPIAFIRDECLIMAEGDLRERSIKIRMEDEVGELAKGFAVMKKNLSSLILYVKSEAEKLASATVELKIESQNCAQSAEKISRAMIDVVDRTKVQSSSTNNASSIADEILGITQNVTAITLEVSTIASKTSKNAAEGQTVVEKAMDQMQKVGASSSAVQESVAGLAEGYREIREIVTLISSIAKQTNLLALNAAIEAARAGEYGKGFSVVAEEVRNLAENSSRAVQKIAALVSANEEKMTQAVEIASAATGAVTTGVEVVNSAGEIFSGIVSSIVSLSDQIKGVSSGIEQISSDNENLASLIKEIEEISEKNIADVNNVSANTEEQLASVEEIASSCNNLAEVAAELQERSAVFQI